MQLTKQNQVSLATAIAARRLGALGIWSGAALVAVATGASLACGGAAPEPAVPSASGSEPPATATAAPTLPVATATTTTATATPAKAPGLPGDCGPRSWRPAARQQGQWRSRCAGSVCSLHASNSSPRDLPFERRSRVCARHT
jgi:hypothetical protein